MLADGTITARIRCAVELDGAGPSARKASQRRSPRQGRHPPLGRNSRFRASLLSGRGGTAVEKIEMLAGACEPSLLFAAKLSEPQRA